MNPNPTTDWLNLVQDPLPAQNPLVKQANDSVLAVAAELDLIDYEVHKPWVQTWRILDETLCNLTIERGDFEL